MTTIKKNKHLLTILKTQLKMNHMNHTLLMITTIHFNKHRRTHF